VKIAELREGLASLAFIGAAAHLKTLGVFDNG